MSRSAEDATSPVDIAIAPGKNQAAFSAQVGEYRVQVLTRLLEGPYPNYEQVIPQGNPQSMTCSRKDLMEAVETAILAELGVPDPYGDLGTAGPVDVGKD